MIISTIDKHTGLILSNNIQSLYKASKKVATDLNLNINLAIEDFIPTISFTKEGELITKVFLIKEADEDTLTDEALLKDFDERYDPAIEDEHQDITDNTYLYEDYIQIFRYLRQLVDDIYDEYFNEIALRELLINTYKGGYSSLELSHDIIKPLIQKALLKGKVQKPFSQYGRQRKKDIKEFLQPDVPKEELTEEEQNMIDEAAEYVDKFFRKMQKGESKREVGGKGLQNDEEVVEAQEDINILERGMVNLKILRSILNNKNLLRIDAFRGEINEEYISYLDTIIDVIRTAYLWFTESKYQYKDDLGVYIKVTAEQAKEFNDQFTGLINYFASYIKNS